MDLNQDRVHCQALVLPVLNLGVMLRDMSMVLL